MERTEAMVAKCREQRSAGSREVQGAGECREQRSAGSRGVQGDRKNRGVQFDINQMNTPTNIIIQWDFGVVFFSILY